MPLQNQNQIPPEEKFRQPGAYDHTKKNWFALHHLLAYVLFGLLAVAIVAGTYIWQVSQYVQPIDFVKHDPTANWKTYTNSQFGFEFKYPADWKLHDSPNTKASTNGDYIDIVDISIIGPNQSPRSGSVDDGASVMFHIGNKFIGQTSAKSLTTNGFTYYMISDPADSFIEGYRTMPNGQTISFWWERDMNDNIVNDFSYTKYLIPLLSTFKFTGSMADWKTYTNSQYGFELKYPNSTSSRPVVQSLGSCPGIYCGTFEVSTLSPGAGGYEPPRLVIRNIEDERIGETPDTGFGALIKNTNKFDGSNSAGTKFEGENPIQFSVGNHYVYANCVNYSKSSSVVEFCNNVLSTFKFTK